MRIVTVVGARPNFVKAAPLVAQYKLYPGIDSLLVHTGQHNDSAMSDVFFDELGIPEPDVNLQVGPRAPVAQISAIMSAFDSVLQDYRPDLVVVLGDVNSTLACALTAAKASIPVAHVEAGLRSFDPEMPEELNRRLTDAASDYLFCTEQSGVENLLREGVTPEKISFVGNVMIDTLMKHQQAASASSILDRLKLTPKEYAVLTLHRPSNVDRADAFGRIMRAVQKVGREIPVIFPVHPRLASRINSGEVALPKGDFSNLIRIAPLPYLDFLKLIACSQIVLTDSGGIQEETTILQVPCLTLRLNTERPITVEMGTNRIVGDQTDDILQGYREAKDNRIRSIKMPPFWDGRAAERIVQIVAERAGLLPKKDDLHGKAISG